MPKADPHTTTHAAAPPHVTNPVIAVTPGRRSVFGALAALTASATLAAAAGPALAAANPDAALLTRCAEFHRLQAIQDHLDNDGADIPDEEADAINDLWWAEFHAIRDMAPRTMAGLRAKATVLAAAIPAMVGGEDSWEPEEQFAMALARDIAGLVA